MDVVIHPSWGSLVVGPAVNGGLPHRVDIEMSAKEFSNSTRAPIWSKGSAQF
jgi:hypothetical protein